jgi:hypothetical protein
VQGSEGARWCTPCAGRVHEQCREAAHRHCSGRWCVPCHCLLLLLLLLLLLMVVVWEVVRHV